MEPPSDYHADNSRSDLSDILEEEEEDFSDPHGEAQARGYTVAANRVRTMSTQLILWPCTHICTGTL